MASRVAGSEDGSIRRHSAAMTLACSDCPSARARSPLAMAAPSDRPGSAARTDRSQSSNSGSTPLRSSSNSPPLVDNSASRRGQSSWSDAARMAVRSDRATVSFSASPSGPSSINGSSRGSAWRISNRVWRKLDRAWSVPRSLHNRSTILSRTSGRPERASRAIRARALRPLGAVSASESTKRKAPSVFTMKTGRCATGLSISHSPLSGPAPVFRTFVPEWSI